MIQGGCILRKTFSIFLIMLFSVLFIWPCPMWGSQDAESPPLYILERDTLQTRNFIPIINHHTMAVNLGKRPLTLELSSDIPVGKFRQGKFYPAFLENSLLPDPLFTPIDITPTNVMYVDRPETIVENESTSFVWKGATLPPGEAVIAQYDNYFGEPNMYWRPYGMEVFGLHLRARYAAGHPDEDKLDLSFEYELVNSTGNTLSDLLLQVFIPIRQMTGEAEVHFLELQRITISPNVDVSRHTRVDGFEKPAYGIAATVNIGELENNETTHFFLSLSGKNTHAEGVIWPTLILRGRSIQKPVWPSTRIETNQPVHEERFNYLSYNLVVQDSQVILFSNQQIEVKSKVPEKKAEDTLIQITMAPGSLGTGLPLQEKIAAIGREHLKRLFPKDLAESRRIDALISLVEQKKGSFTYQVQAVFLYRGNYLAVNHEIIFKLSGENSQVISSN